MKWQKLHFLYNCENLHPKLKTHAANPLPIRLENDIYRVFFSARDKDNRSSVGAVDIDLIKGKVINEFDQPFFQHGDNKSFYSHGVSIGNTYSTGDKTYMLFMGWQNPSDDHWFGEIGRLIVHDDLTLSIDSETPFLPLDDIDPISLSYPWVLKEKGIYRMWYGSTVTWDAGNNEMLHIIKYAESVDGHSWEKKDFPVPYKLGEYQAFSRPTILKNADDQYSMWFSCRSGDGSTYRIASATSKNAKEWKLSPQQNSIVASQNGWDSEMIEYPFVLSHNEKTYMLYNGNGYGKSGFGIAELVN